MAKTFAEQLEWRDNTPDRVITKKSTSKRIGKKLKLPFNEFLYNLYIANETLKKNDGELFRQVMLEYGDVKDVKLKRLLRRKDRNWVQHYRNEFNRGKLNTKEPPPGAKGMSWRYIDGLKVNGHTGQPATKKYIEQRKDLYQTYRRDWFMRKELGDE